MAKVTRRVALLAGGAALGAAGASYLGGHTPVLDGVATAPPTPEGWLNDASGLSPTPVHKHIVLTENPDDDLIAGLRAELAEARAEGRPVNVGAARHSMGGQSIPRDGHAITFQNRTIESDRDALTYRVHAGSRWSHVIAHLDPRIMSPKVMQSNNDFGVAATFSVNAHGWPVPHGPMGSTVRSLRMVLPDGSLVTCSRSENAELFAHAMGGYGLIGLIVDLELEAEKNLRLVPEHSTMPATEFAPAFIAAANDPGVNMAYGRLNVEKDGFFEEAMLIAYRPSENQAVLPAASGSGFVSRASALLYRAQLGREPLKALRWEAETRVSPTILGGSVTRNSLMNEPVVTLDDRDPQRTDILHEYFVSAERFPDFLEVCRTIIPATYQELLNVTLRYVAADTTSVLSYAPFPRIAAVMSFSQEMTERAEIDMTRMTRDLIDAVISIGGTYYLPYRPHATVEQFARAYPGAAGFAAFKRGVDPSLTLRNALWDNYLGIV